jgi:hypothetical protein
MSFQVTNSCGEDIQDSSRRHNKHYVKARRGERRDTLPTPVTKVQETNNDPGAVTPRPIDVSHI